MAVKWRLAKSLEALRKQINGAFPKRSKLSDGTIGNAEHAARNSEHNPNKAGVVCAWDVTHDPANGVNCFQLATALQFSKDARIRYIIWNGQITQKTDVTKWQPYTGANAHKHHLHLSAAADPKLYDDGKAWDLSALASVIAESHGIYTVAAGDTLTAILKRFKLTLDVFRKLNDFNKNNFDPDNIQTGQEFRVS